MTRCLRLCRNLLTEPSTISKRTGRSTISPVTHILRSMQQCITKESSFTCKKESTSQFQKLPKSYEKSCMTLPSSIPGVAGLRISTLPISSRRVSSPSDLPKSSRYLPICSFLPEGRGTCVIPWKFSHKALGSKFRMSFEFIVVIFYVVILYY